MSAFEQFGRQIQGACRYKMYVLYRIWIVAMASINFGVAGVWLWTALIGRWLLLTPDWCLMVLYTLVILLLTQKTGLWGLESNIHGVRYYKQSQGHFLPQVNVLAVVVSPTLSSLHILTTCTCIPQNDIFMRECYLHLCESSVGCIKLYCIDLSRGLLGDLAYCISLNSSCPWNVPALVIWL